jgi:hypothetical protein
MMIHAQNQLNLHQHVGQVRLFCLTEPAFLIFRFGQVQFWSFLSVFFEPNLTEPNRTCKNSQITEQTEPLTPLFRGGQVRFGSVARRFGFNGNF